MYLQKIILTTLYLFFFFCLSLQAHKDVVFSPLSSSFTPKEFNELHVKIDHLLAIDPEAALNAATEAWELVVAHGTAEQLAIVERDMAGAYYHLAHFDNAISHYEKALNIYTNNHNHLEEAHVKVQLSKVYITKGDNATAGNFLLAAVPVLKQHQDDKWLAISQLYTANRLKKLEQYTKANTAYNTAISFFQTNPTTHKELLLEAYTQQHGLLMNKNALQHLNEKTASLRLYFILFILFTFVCSTALVLSLLHQKRLHRTQLQKRVDEHTAELQKTNEHLEEANKELKRFAYISSHDLKEPLRNIASFTTLIKRRLADHIDQDTEEYFQFVNRSTRQITDLVTDIFEYSKLDGESIALTYVDMNEVVENAISPLESIIKTKNAEVIYKNLPTMYSNPLYLQLIFKNIIENGIKYNQSAIPQIKINCVEDHNHFQFNIMDNGIGISKEYHQYIFEMFRRLHNREAEGSGLGLAICRKILRQLHGKIWVDNNPTGGTIFHILLPKTMGDNNTDNTPLNTSIKFSSQLNFSIASTAF